jgi:hypothetical protein
VHKVFEEAFIKEATRSTGMATMLWWQWAGEVLFQPVVGDSIIYCDSTKGNLMGTRPFFRNPAVLPTYQDAIRPWTEAHTLRYNDMLKRTVSEKILNGILGERHPCLAKVMLDRHAFGPHGSEVSVGIHHILKPEAFLVGRVHPHFQLYDVYIRTQNITYTCHAF